MSMSVCLSICPSVSVCLSDCLSASISPKPHARSLPHNVDWRTAMSMSVYLSVCLSVREHISETARLVLASQRGLVP